MIELKNLINNEFSSGSDFHDVFDPAKAEVIAKMPISNTNDVKQAVDAAKEAFHKWSEVSFSKRLKTVWKLKDLIENREEEIAKLLATNNGKTYEEAFGEVLRAKENIESSISFIHKSGTKIRNIYSDIDTEIYREPLGVFAAISPFNFPIMIPFWFIPYALIFGNTMVLKPSEMTPLCHKVTAEIFKKELPKGVVNIVYGKREVAEELIKNKDIAGICFVGSTPAAKSVYESSLKHGKRVIAGGGANNRVVVMPDANLEASMKTLINSFYGMAGQRCLAGSVLITLEENYDKVKKMFVESAKKIRLGYMLDSKTDMGPLVSQKSKERVINYIENAEHDGVNISLDGRGAKVNGYENGYWLGPTVVESVGRDMDIYKDEVFGPVAVLLKAKDFDEAMEMVNEGNFGNAGSIFTSSGKTARDFIKRACVGNVGINLGVAQPPPYTTFAGKKESFFGVLHGQADTLDFFTDRKIIIERWN